MNIISLQSRATTPGRPPAPHATASTRCPGCSSAINRSETPRAVATRGVLSRRARDAPPSPPLAAPRSPQTSATRRTCPGPPRGLPLRPQSLPAVELDDALMLAAHAPTPRAPQWIRRRNKERRPRPRRAPFPSFPFRKISFTTSFPNSDIGPRRARVSFEQGPVLAREGRVRAVDDVVVATFFRTFRSSSLPRTARR